jgi:hypothetical protein
MTDKKPPAKPPQIIERGNQPRPQPLNEGYRPSVGAGTQPKSPPASPPSVPPTGALPNKGGAGKK